MCNSMWTSLNRNLNKKSEYLIYKGQYTYNILNEHPKNTAKKLQTNSLLQKIKCSIPHVTNEINKPCYHNLTDYQLNSQDISFLQQHKKTSIGYSKQDLLRIASQQINIARKLECSLQYPSTTNNSNLQQSNNIPTKKKPFYTTRPTD